MKTIFSIAIIFILLSSNACKKNQQSSCDFDMCDSRRNTVLIATNWSGSLGYYNDFRKWAINVSIPNSIDGIRTCIICGNIPDSLKKIGRIVTFSGELKENCNDVKPIFGGQEIYFVNPTYLK